jgi:tetratricopeptide (TPR) repeat protein
MQMKAQAEQAFLSAIQRGSASFEAWQNLLALEAESGKFDSLIFHSEQGLEIFPNQAMLYYFNGYGNLSKKNYRQACSSLEQARKLSAANPNLVHDINSMLGDAYNGTKEYSKSDQAFEASLTHDPNNVFVLNNYSYYLSLRKEHLEKAEKMSAQTVRDHPDNATYLDTYAWVLYAREKYREARKVMEHALELPGVSFVHYDHYGDILFQMGDVDGAVRQWEKARSMTSEHDEIDKKIANRRLY